MIIGLAGRKRSGKSTAARYLVENHGVTELSFADPLKRMALAVDPRVGPESDPVRLSEAVGVWGWEEAKDRFPEVRRFLQRLGTEGVRDHIGQDTWVNLAELEIIRVIRENEQVDQVAESNIVFADIRFENEAALIREWGGVVIEVYRPSQGDPEPEHSSEAGVRADHLAVNPEGDKNVLFSVLDYCVSKVTE